MNTPIQGTAADMIKLAMIHVDTALTKAGLQARMLLQVHDELLFEMPASEADQARAIIVDAMKNALQLPHGVQAEVEAGTGTNWLQAH
jgi:DNA polymerase-1